MATTVQENPLVISILKARASFGKLIEQVDLDRRSLVIEKRGAPKAVLLSLRDYVRLAAPEPEILRLIGVESERNETSKLTSRKIDQVIRASRDEREKK